MALITPDNTSERSTIVSISTQYAAGGIDSVPHATGPRVTTLSIAGLLAEAIKRAGTTEGPKLRDAIAATKDFDGVTGKFSLDAKRDAVKSAAILQIKDGKFKFLETIAP